MPDPAGLAPTYQSQPRRRAPATIAKGDTYPTAMILVFALAGDFDVAEAIKHADADAELSGELQEAQRLQRRLSGASRRR